MFSQHNSLSEIGAKGFLSGAAMLSGHQYVQFQMQILIVNHVYTHMGSNFEILGIPLVH